MSTVNPALPQIGPDYNIGAATAWEHVKQRLPTAETVKVTYKSATDAIKFSLKGAKQALLKGKSPALLRANFALGLTSSAFNVGTGIIAIGLAVAQTIQDIRGAQTGLGKAGALFLALSPTKPLLVSLTGLAGATITLAAQIGGALKTIPSSVLANLGIAAAALGAATGGLTIVLGLGQIGKGIYDIVKKHRVRINEMTGKIQDLTDKVHEAKQNLDDPVNKLLLTKYSVELRKAKHERTKSIFLIACGVSTTICGALAVAAAFTQGTTLGIVVAISLTIGAIGIGISIAGYVSKKKEEKAIAAQSKQFPEILQALEKQYREASTEDRQQICKRLGIDPSSGLEAVLSKANEIAQELSPITHKL